MNPLHAVAWAGVGFAVLILLIAGAFGPMRRDRESLVYLLKGLVLIGLVVAGGVTVLQGAVS